MQARAKQVIPLVALTAVVIVVAGLQHSLLAPKTFRGTVRYPIIHTGDEGSQAVLVTSTGSFDLFSQQKFGWKAKLEGFAGRKAVIIGRARMVHGTYRPNYSAIDVVEMMLEEVQK